MILAYIGLILFLIALNAFFVGVEFAAVSSRRARLDILVDPDSRSARIVHAWLEQPQARDRLIAGSQLGITIVSLALGSVGEQTFALLLEPVFSGADLPEWLAILQAVVPALPLLMSLVVVTGLHVVLGEQVPKVAVLRAPERFALLAAPWMDVFTRVFKWFVDLLDWITRKILNFAGLPAVGTHTTVYSIEELREIMTGPETEGVIEQPERDMLSAVIDFGELIVRQISLPRTEIIAVEKGDLLDEAIRLMLDHSLTKIPVYEENLDHILGVIHLRDMVVALQQRKTRKITAGQLTREVLFVPESISVNDLILEFRSRKTHIAIVLDEFGGTYGLVTLEDLLEEIVGEFQDTFKATSPPIVPQTDGSALIEGMTLIEEVNEHFGLKLSDRNYNTIAGYVLGKMGRIPRAGDVMDDSENQIRIKVEKMDHLRIEQVSLHHL